MAVLGHSVEMSVHLTAEFREGLVVIVRGSGGGREGQREAERKGGTQGKIQHFTLCHAVHASHYAS